jgi:tRNA G10  N-methylase Trm11
MLFVIGCACESHKQAKRFKLWKEILRLKERLIVLKNHPDLNDSEVVKIKNKIKIMWEEYKTIWYKFRFKEIMKEKVEKMEKFLKTEKII